MTDNGHAAVSAGETPEQVRLSRDVLQARARLLRGYYDDADIARLFETIAIQRKVLRELFNLFKREPFRLISVADPIRNSVLAHYKELVSMEDQA